jgi:hypothetical protein
MNGELSNDGACPNLPEGGLLSNQGDLVINSSNRNQDAINSSTDNQDTINSTTITDKSKSKKLNETEQNQLNETEQNQLNETERNQPVTYGVNPHHRATDETAVKPTLTSNNNVTAHHHLMTPSHPDPQIDDGPPNRLSQTYSNAGVPARIPRVPESPQDPNRIGTAKGDPQTSRDDRAMPEASRRRERTPQPTGDHRLRACPSPPLTFGRKGGTGECCEPGTLIIHHTADCPLVPPEPSPASGGLLSGGALAAAAATGYTRTTGGCTGIRKPGTPMLAPVLVKRSHALDSSIPLPPGVVVESLSPDPPTAPAPHTSPAHALEHAPSSLASLASLASTGGAEYVYDRAQRAVHTAIQHACAVALGGGEQHMQQQQQRERRRQADSERSDRASFASSGGAPSRTA